MSKDLDLDLDLKEGEQQEDNNTENNVKDEKDAEKVEKGESGRTQRDMQTVTDNGMDDRPSIDIQSIERAIDKLVKIREMDLKRAERPFVPKRALKPEDVKTFIEKTGETKIQAEKYLDAANGDMCDALVAWTKAPYGFDYETYYPVPESLSSFSLMLNKV